MSPADMPQNKPARYIQGRHSALVRKWSDGKWKIDKQAGEKE